MGKSFAIEIKGIDKITKAFTAFPVSTARALNDTIKMSALFLEREIKDEIRNVQAVDTGRLMSSVKTTLGNLQATVGPTTDYAIYVHEGTRPHWPPIRAIAPWAKRHGISPYLVARSIAKKGTKGRPFVETAVNRSRGRIETFFEMALDKISSLT